MKLLRLIKWSINLFVYSLPSGFHTCLRVYSKYRLVRVTNATGKSIFFWTRIWPLPEGYVEYRIGKELSK